MKNGNEGRGVLVGRDIGITLQRLCPRCSGLKMER